MRAVSLPPPLLHDSQLSASAWVHAHVTACPAAVLGWAVNSAARLPPVCRYISSDGPGKQQLLAWLASDLQQQLDLLAAAGADSSPQQLQQARRDGLQPEASAQQQREEQDAKPFALQHQPGQAPRQQRRPAQRSGGSEGDQQLQQAVPAPPGGPAARSWCCCW